MDDKCLTEGKYLTDEELELLFRMTRDELVDDMTVRDGRELVCEPD